MDKILYSICEEDIQNEAQYHLGRALTENELEIVADMLSNGIGETISPIYHEIFNAIQHG